MIIHISELSRKTGVSVRSLRYYEKKGLLRPTRLENGYRRYDVSDIERVQRGRSLMVINMGLTTAIVFGVPFGTWIGAVYGWKRLFALVAILGMVRNQQYLLTEP